MALPASPARAPLHPARTYPTPSSSPSKRVSHHPKAHSQSATKRKVMSIPLSSSPAATPAPLKTAQVTATAIPYFRLMSPSSSTVAASSSPKRGPMSSSPITSKTLRVSASPLNVTVPVDRTIVLGRHRTRLPAGTATPQASGVPLSATIPSHHQLLRHPERPVDILPLPRAASHASRVHAVLEYDAEADSIRVAVIGQNGVRVRGGDRRKSRRVKRGDVLDVPRSEVQVDFYGCLVHLAFPPVPAARDSIAASEADETPRKLEMPPSSPPMELTMEVEGEDEMDVDEKVAIEVEDDDDGASSGLSAAEEEEKEVKEELLDGALGSVVPPPAPALAEVTEATTGSAIEDQAKDSKPASREPSPEDLPLPAGVDLAAILASTVVFSGSSKMSLPDMVKHMLESQPSLKDHGSESRWTRWVHAELDSNAMFGKVDRHGKDASGRPLLPHFFYNPEQDPDANRAAQLSGLVRPLRAAQRAGGKAIDWRPVGGGRRR